MPPSLEVQMVSKLDLDDKDVTPVKQSGIGEKIMVTTGKEVMMTDNMKRLFYNLLTALLTLGLILSVSVFTYATFYFAYMPSEVHEEDINFQFTPCVSSPGLCSFPNATLHLDPKKHRLMTGQSYRIGVMVEVPDSVANQELGMFMSCLKVVDSNNMVTATSCKSSILEFRSSLLRMMETIVFSPFLLTSTTTQRQWIMINYFSDFYDDPTAPASRIVVELQSKFIQVYTTRLQVHAQLSGLRHIMHHHPWISSISGVVANIIILTIIILISWTRIFTLDTQYPEEDYTKGKKQPVADKRKEKFAETETLQVFHKTSIGTIG